MRVAIYIRVSTDEQAASAETQEQGARLWCERNGHNIVAAYRDIGFSGAEWVHRPGILRLQEDSRRSPRPWDLVVVRDVDRLGRDGVRLPLLLSVLRDVGVGIVESSTGQTVTLDSTGQMIASVRAYIAQIERETIAHRVRTAHATQHTQGRVVGGVVYGYRNVRSAEGVRYEIDEPQAMIVKEIFERHAEGVGIRALVADLNVRGVPSPRAGGRGTGSWSPSVVWNVLRNERYTGLMIWGRRGNVYRGGTQVDIARPESEWIRLDQPHLRIVPDELWQRVQSTDEAPARAEKRGREPKYLLTSLARCAECGGPMQVSRKRHGKVDIKVYQCSWARDRGEAVCTNKLRRPIEELDGAITGWIERNLFNETILSRVLASVRRRLVEVEQRPLDESATKGAELRKVQQEIERIADAIVRADSPPDALVRRLTEREKRAKELRAELNAPSIAVSAMQKWKTIEAEVRRRMTDLGALMRRNLAGAREVLSTLLTAPLRCAAIEVDGARRYKITGEVVVPLLIEAVGGGKIKHGASPEGQTQTPSGTISRPTIEIYSAFNVVDFDPTFECEALAPEPFHLAA